MTSPDLPAELGPFVAAVRRNCHITDARHAREMTLCNYLLEMREFYRWECGLPFGVAPPRAEVGAWLTEREALWEELEGEDFARLPLEGAEHDPFARDELNPILSAHGLYYGAGIGRFGKPHFFLARLDAVSERSGVPVLVCDREYVRDMSTMPAALQAGAIIVRRTALRRWLWEQVEAAGAKQATGPLQRAFEAYGVGTDAAAVERMVEAETETLIRHELGEHMAGASLGPMWEELLAACRSRQAEVLARAVRDNLADCGSTLPSLLAGDAAGALHFWFANFSGMRLALFPGLRAAYGACVERGDWDALADRVDAGGKHWLQVAQRFLELFSRLGQGIDGELKRLSQQPGEIAL